MNASLSPELVPTRLPDPEQEARQLMRLGLGALVLLLGGALLWASLAPLDQGVTGAGTVVVQGERKSLQALLGGAVERIDVGNGDRVSQGQVLLVFNTVQARSQLQVVLGKLISSRSVEARLLAERLGQERIEWPSDLQALANDPRAHAAMQLQDNLFHTRREELHSRLSILEHEQVALQEQLHGQEKVKRSADQQLEYQQRELHGLRSLAEEGFVPRNRLFEAERGNAQLSAQLAASVADIGATRQALNENRFKVLQAKQQFRSEAQGELTQVAADASAYADQLRALRFEVDNGELRAPVSGQVMGLNVHTVGAVVEPGERVLDVVPEGAPWVVNARFPTLVADKLYVGLPVHLQFSALQRPDTPVVFGHVEAVSADQLIDEATREPYFAVRVIPEAVSVKRLQASALLVRPGMQADVIVATGERTLMNYLLKPLRERLVKAFQEE